MWIKKTTVALLESENVRKTDIIVEMGHERCRLQQSADHLREQITDLRTQVSSGAKREDQTLADHRVLSARVVELRAQKAKDDLSIDWLRHRVNSLEKTNAQLLAKAAGIFIPVPEIVPTRPGSMTEPPDFDSMPSFEDVGDAEAERLGITHDLDGTLVYGK